MKLRHFASFTSMIMTSLTGGQGRAVAAEPEPIDWSAVPLPAIAGGALPPDLLRGKVVLLVNTASYCGFTPQYQGLQALWKRYRDRGFVLLGVPANDFGAQEPGSDSEISQFCQVTYGIDFPMLAKQTVVGPDAHPLYRWAASQTGRRGLPKWNFHKILIGRDGRLAAWFSTMIDPASPKLAAAIEQALAAH
ncbi:MAG: glutathione peroxidase [Pseudomonadota bacterium]